MNQGRHQGHHAADMLTRLLVSCVLLSGMFLLSWYSSAWWSHAIQLVCVSGIVLYGGAPFFKGMYHELAGRRPGMMTLVGLALAVSYGYSIAVFLGMPGQLFFHELSTLVVIMLFGHWLEMRSISFATESVRSLTKELPTQARIVTSDDTTQTQDIALIRTGMVLRVKPGEYVPADGVVKKGVSEVSQAPLTGEFEPKAVQVGDSVIAGALNISGTIDVTVLHDTKNSYLAHVQRIVEKTLSRSSPVQDRADHAAYVLTVCAVIISIGAFVWWYSAPRALSFALERAVTVLVMACPHALGLAIPLVVVIVITQAAQKGILITDRRAFEQCKDVTVLACDKTGTLTMGHFKVDAVIPYGATSQEEIVALAAASESYGQHPLGTAIGTYAHDMGYVPLKAQHGTSYPGKGVVIAIGQDRVVVGNILLLKQEQVVYDAAQSQADRFVQAGATLVYVARNHELLGSIACSDSIRRDSLSAVKTLQARGIRLLMLTGDTQTAAEGVGKSLGITEAYGGMTPQDKATFIRALVAEDEIVMMVGDGINDAPALAEADVGVAMGSGTELAHASASIVLVKSSLAHVVALIDLSTRYARKVSQNIVLATMYNIIALPLAAGVLIPFGLVVPPAFGALLMSLSTIVVALNAQLLHRSS